MRTRVLDTRGDGALGIGPEHWRHWASAPPVGGLRPILFDRASLQSWAGTEAEMSQPAMDHHLVVLHQGGAKRVRRRAGALTRVIDVPLHASTTVESGSSYGWTTEGPIAFSHLYIKPMRFAELVAEVYDRPASSVGFAESIGRSDPYVAHLFALMFASAADPDWKAVADHYLDAMLVRLAATSRQGAEFAARGQSRMTLTPLTIARVRDYVQANIAQQTSLDDLAAVAGYSRYHFVRAFKHSTGQTPYAFLLEKRIASALALLRDGDLPIAAIARRTGFASHAHFSASFRAKTGVTPATYRRDMRGRVRPA